MTRSAAILMGLYGLVSLVGGTYGYLTKGSMASLIAGGVSGLLLIGCAALVFRKPLVGLLLGLVVAVALLVRFLPALMKSLDGSEGLNAVALIMTVGGMLTAGAAGFALAKLGGFKGGS